LVQETSSTEPVVSNDGRGEREGCVVGPSIRPVRARFSAVCVTALSVAAVAVVLVVAPRPAGAATRAEVLSSAGAYGPAHGYQVGIAVFDTKTGKVYGAGSNNSTFASESVVKVFIATRILLQGRMHGATAVRARTMIAQSDDAIASSLYGSVGGDSLITWIKNYYHVPNLGSPPRRAGWWGGTYITPDGLVRLYAKLKADNRVRHWLFTAMHAATKYGSDGFYQYFGIPSATSNAAIKQGWGNDYAGSNASENSTGFVNGDRYAVAILARGPASTYGARIGAMLTTTARRLLPNGWFPDNVPTITSTTSTSGVTTGGNAFLLHGTDFTHVSAVMFGIYHAHTWSVLSQYTIKVSPPAHPAGIVTIQVVTSHGTSSVSGPHYKYVSPPTVTTLSATSGSTDGGTTLTITGTNFVRVSNVLFGSTPGLSLKVTSSTSLQVVTPPRAAGPVHVQVSTAYAVSPTGAADLFTYVVPPAVSEVGPSSGAGPGSTDITTPASSDPATARVPPAP
jgi:hypothetical protein